MASWQPEVRCTLIYEKKRFVISSKIFEVRRICSVLVHVTSSPIKSFLERPYSERDSMLNPGGNRVKLSSSALRLKRAPRDSKLTIFDQGHVQLLNLREHALIPAGEVFVLPRQYPILCDTNQSLRSWRCWRLVCSMRCQLRLNTYFQVCGPSVGV